MEQPPAPEDSSSPSSGPARCTTKNPPWFITITAITTPETEGGSTVTPSLKKGGWNLYAFVGNSLNIEIDLLGTAWSSLQTEAGAALAARQAAEAAAKAAARAAGTAIAAERSKRNKRCAELYREKSEAKKEARGSSCRDMIIPECPTQSECNAFNDRYEKMKRLAEARKAYDDECHQGGDKGHQEQSKGWNEGAQNCKNKYDECITKLNKLI